MGIYDGKCDDCFGANFGPGKYHPWQLHQVGTRTLCDWHYEQYKREQDWQEHKRKQRSYHQGRKPQSTSEPTGEGGFGLRGFFIAVIAVGVCVLVYQLVSTISSAKFPHLWPHLVTPNRSPHVSAAQYKVIVNGVEAVGQGPFSLLSCNPTSYLGRRDATTITASNPATAPGPGNGGASVLVTNTDPPQVVNVDLHSYPNKHWSWDRKQQPGNAAVTKTGNTYHIVGTIPPASGSPETQSTGANPVPFEFDATCP
jgi:Mycobacterium 19 kDa lipoprotein antigen